MLPLRLKANVYSRLCLYNTNDYSHLQSDFRMRHTPKQERGRQRVNQILDAASEIFSEIGYEAATTIMIAERAKTAVGSLYQFFPNKESILQALAARYVAQAGAMFDAVNVESFAELTLEEMLDQFFTPLKEFIRHSRDFYVLFASSQGSAAVTEAIRPMDEALLARMDAALAQRVPSMPRAERRKYQLVCMTILKGMLGMAHLYADELTLDEIFEELRAVYLAYLRPIMGD